MAKFFFENGDFDEDERCYQKQHFIDLLKERELTEMEVFKAKLDTHSGYFYCSEFGEIGETKQGSCGKDCEFYAPRNGKSGRCKSSKGTYIAGESVIIRLKR